MRRFTAGYGFGRGIIYYAHFAEDFASKELTSAISSIPEIKDVDAVLRVLTGPTKISPLLRQYFHPRKLLTKQQRSLLKRYPTLRRSGQLTKYLQWLSYYHEVGERSTSGCFVRFASFLEKLSTRTGVLVGDLQWYTEPELQALLRKGVVLSLREIRTRQKYYVLRMVGGKLRLYTGKEAHALLRQELPRVRVQRVDILRGVTACPGKPRRGVVRVIKKQADIEKMRRGDILVSPMTTPRLMEAVKHAAAIVTDEGGVTCHAAIVSRELHIPCIIGTKTASHVLHDGDRVLVDATAGIVRRLRNAVA
jgi:phosphohistidine swiveling domain-containing protein